MVTVLTAQGKFSGWIVAAVPVGLLFIFIALINPQQLDPLFRARRSARSSSSLPS